MNYKNEVLVFPMGMKTNSNLTKSPCYYHKFESCKFKMSNRRKTLRIGNAIRMKNLTEDCNFDDCTIFLEGTLTSDGIIPYSLTNSFIYRSGRV